jgi:hypothetical protein
MTRHDAQMLRFGQWWRRQVRSGYGSMNVASKVHGHERPFAAMIRSTRIWTIGWTLGIAAGPVVGMMAGSRGLGLLISVAVFVLVFMQAGRVAMKTIRRGYPVGTSVGYGFMTMVAKWGMLIGQWKYWSDRAAKKTRRIIEYKAAPTEGRA